MKNHERTVRLFGLFFFFVTLYIIIIARLTFLQILYTGFYTELGLQQYTLKITHKPLRGIIYDRNGIPLAYNTSSYALFITPKTMANKKTTLRFIKKAYPAAYERYTKNPTTNFLYIKRKLTEKERALIQAQNNDDLHVLEEPMRYYPHHETGQIVGFTTIDNEGAAGVELTFNEFLSGKPTSYFLERDARSGMYHFNKNMLNQGNEGQSLTLSIDSTLQYLAFQELTKTINQFESKEGSVLIMDPTTGELLTMVSYPLYDPLDTEIHFENAKAKPVTDAYELGSVIKIFPALAALAEGVVTPDEVIDCENKKIIYLDGVKFSTWKEHGLLRYEDVVAISNNIGTAKVAKRLGNKLYNHFLHLGFNKKTGIELPAEQSGYINPPHLWTTQSPFSLSFGYEIRATMLQLAQAISIFTNGGYLVSPTIIKGKKTTHTKTNYDPIIIEQVRTMMKKTITEGTAHRAKIPNVLVLGKTGTATLLDDNGTYNHDRCIFTFAGIVEIEDYKRVIIVFIKEANKKNIYSSSVSVPLFNRVAQKMLIHDHKIDTH